MKKHLPLIIIVLSILIFSPSLLNFFSGDDWFHLSLVQIKSFSEFASFFSFNTTAQTASFYRPLSTQVFFFIFYFLFGLKSYFYHAFVLFSFACSLYLLYKLSILILKDKTQSLIVLILYSFSVTHFTKLYFLSAFQEILVFNFVLLSLYAHIKKKFILAYVYFILALMSKETAIVLPFLFLLTDYYLFKRVNYLKKYVFYIIISLVYLYLRLVIFQGGSGDSYVWNFSFSKALNTLSWYFLWSLGSPEFLLDYVASGARVVSKFFSDFGYLSWPILSSIISVVFAFIIISIQYLVRNRPKITKAPRTIIFGALWFLITLAPVIFLPWHKFQLELTLPLFGFSLALSELLKSRNKLSLTFIALFLYLNLFSYYLTYPRHYSIGRAKISRKIYTYLQHTPLPLESSYLEFANDTGNYGLAWGQSKQIAFSLSKSDFFKVFYKDKNIKVYYQDFPQEKRPLNKTLIRLSSSQFIH